MRIIIPEDDVFESAASDTGETRVREETFPRHSSAPDEEDGAMRAFSGSLDRIIVETARTVVGTAALLDVKISEINAAIARLEAANAVVGGEVREAATAVAGNSLEIGNLLARARQAIDGAQAMGEEVHGQFESDRAVTAAMLTQQGEEMAAAVRSAALELRMVCDSSALRLTSAADMHGAAVARYGHVVSSLEDAIAAVRAAVDEVAARAEFVARRRQEDTVALVSDTSGKLHQGLETLGRRQDEIAAQVGQEFRSTARQLAGSVERAGATQARAMEEILEAQRKLKMHFDLVADAEQQRVNRLLDTVVQSASAVSERLNQLDEKAAKRADEMERRLLQALADDAGRVRRARVRWNALIVTILCGIAILVLSPSFVIFILCGIVAVVVYSCFGGQDAERTGTP